MVLLIQLLGTLIVVAGAMAVGAIVFLPFFLLWAWGRLHNERNV